MALGNLVNIDRTRLARARDLCHAACQWPSRAARANLAAAPDDGHSNLGWDADHGALVGRPLDAGKRIRAGFRFGDAALLWLVDDAVADALPLSTAAERDAGAWLDARLADAGLTSTSAVEMPYELPAVAGYTDLEQLADEGAALGGWFGAADAGLTVLVAENGRDAVRPLDVRCWPHHFDIATLFALESGDPETARSIGAGLSPGDAGIGEPYLYCSPWPAPDTADLPAPPGALRWHTDGFVSVVGRAGELGAGADLAALFRDAYRCVRELV